MLTVGSCTLAQRLVPQLMLKLGRPVPQPCPLKISETIVKGNKLDTVVKAGYMSFTLNMKKGKKSFVKYLTTHETWNGKPLDVIQHYCCHVLSTLYLTFQSDSGYIFLQLARLNSFQNLIKMGIVSYKNTFSTFCKIVHLN